MRANEALIPLKQAKLCTVAVFEALLIKNLSHAELIALLVYFALFFLDLQLGKGYDYYS